MLQLKLLTKCRYNRSTQIRVAVHTDTVLRYYNCVDRAIFFVENWADIFVYIYIYIYIYLSLKTENK
jgi:hypothetical protein